MSAFNVSGTLINVYEVDKRESDDPDRFKAQILADLTNKNGDRRKELLDISMKDAALKAHLEKLQGQFITAPVGIMSPADSRNIFVFFPPGTTTESIRSVPASSAKSA